MKKPRSYKPPEYLASLARKVIDRRGGRFGISIRDAARESGISAATLSRIERGAVPDIDTFRSLCFWLGESADVLLGLVSEDQQ